MNSSNNYYNVYLNQVFMLAETIVIKSTEAVDAINYYNRNIYGIDVVDMFDPSSYKYYMNIAGEYHSTDIPMIVISMDTMEEIIFSKENLLIHRATAREYAYGTRNYTELVSRYPRQKMLILGILYPVDKQKAIDAPDGTILGYPTNMVEHNEYSLINNLQKWINAFKIRWTNKQYGLIEELYPTTSLGVMYLNLIPAILNLRLAACKTNEAHSFHVRQFLASHGFLDDYIDNLTTKQAMWFYRNINYIERNSGCVETFETLIEHIMTERGLPLGDYTMKHDVSYQTEELYSEVKFNKKPLNLGYNLDSLDNIDLRTLLLKEDPIAFDNTKYRDEYEVSIKEEMENSLSNVLKTKVLESTMVDYTDSSPYTFEDTLLNHWLYMVAHNKYKAVILFSNPITGERVPLGVKDAYIFMMYCFCKACDIDLKVIPQFYAKRVIRQPYPSVDELMEIVDPKYIDRSVAEYALSLMPSVPPIISTEAFYNQCLDLNKAANVQRNLVAYQEHLLSRGFALNLISLIYSDSTYWLEPEGTLYDSWLSTKGIVTDKFERDDYESLYLSILKEATGISINNTRTIKDLQRAMLRLFQQLSSYSIHLVSDINSSNIKAGNGVVIRIGDMNGHTSLEIKNMDICIDIIHRKGHGKQRVRYITAPFTDAEVKGHGVQTVSYDIPPFITKGKNHDTQLEYLELPMVGYYYQIPPLDNPRNVIPVPGIKEYLDLPIEEQGKIVDVWGNDFNQPIAVHLVSVFNDPDIGGFEGI